jgi:uncharacterized membrane protein YbjE (DUF340 family)
MWKLIFFFISGTFVGVLLKKQEKMVRVCSRLSEYSVYLLLFLLGFSMGVNPAIIKNIFSMGVDAFLLSIFSIVGSILAILPLERKIK